MFTSQEKKMKTNNDSKSTNYYIDNGRNLASLIT